MSYMDQSFGLNLVVKTKHAKKCFVGKNIIKEITNVAIELVSVFI